MEIEKESLKKLVRKLPEDNKASLAFEIKKCPKCQTLNYREALECLRCGVIFNRLLNLPMDPRLKARPFLVKLWQDVLFDFENVEKHEQFISSCEIDEALSYALKVYLDIKEAQPFDATTIQMLELVKEKYQEYENKKKRMVFFSQDDPLIWHEFKKIKNHIYFFPWRRKLKLFPLFISFGLIAFGMTNPQFRNLVGFGAVVMFLTFGIVYFLKGHVHFSDFW